MVLKKCPLPYQKKKKNGKGELKIRGRQWIWNYMLRQTPRKLPKRSKSVPVAQCGVWRVSVIFCDNDMLIHFFHGRWLSCNR